MAPKCVPSSCRPKPDGSSSTFLREHTHLSTPSASCPFTEADPAQPPAPSLPPLAQPTSFSPAPLAVEGAPTPESSPQDVTVIKTTPKTQGSNAQTAPLALSPAFPLNVTPTVHCSGGVNNDDNQNAGPHCLPASRSAQYRQNWSKVMLGATSGIIFVFVLWIGHLLYRLVAPYYYSITNAVLLSILMHPQGRLHSALYMSTAVERMRCQQQAWATQGRLAGVIGSWLSLRHFASFILMQATFFLGLNKICVAPNFFLLGGDKDNNLRVTVAAAAGDGNTYNATSTTTIKTKKEGVKELASAGESRASSPHPHVLASVFHASSSSWLQWPFTTGPLTSTAIRGTATAVVAHSRSQRRLVATPRGRRLLRYLTLATIVLLAHLLVGVVYFTLLHLALGVAFALVVPLVSAETFVTSMGRLWRAAVVLFFMVGLAASLKADVVSIGGVVNRAVSAMADSGSGSGGGGVPAFFGSTWKEVYAMKSFVSQGGPVVDFPNTVHHGASKVSGNTNTNNGNPGEGKGEGDKGSANNFSQLGQHFATFVNRVYLLFSNNTATASNNSIRNSRDNSTKSSSKGPILSTVLSSLTALGTGGADKKTVPNYWTKVWDFLTCSSCVERFLGFVLMPFHSLVILFDSTYAAMLFVFVYRYLIQLDHTVLYYGIAKLLRVIQPEVGDYHARIIEHDITVSFVTLLQSFGHLAWFHFCITFCAFKLWGIPAPSLLGLVSVVAALFPLMPKWLSPCSFACAYAVAQLVILMRTEVMTGEDGSGTTIFSGSPFLIFPDGRSWTETLVFGKPYLFHYARVISLGVATLLEVSDGWLLCVSRGTCDGFVKDAANHDHEQLQPFVIATSIILGFVAYGIRGIVLGPLTIIVARVLYDNWDIVLSCYEPSGPSPPGPTSVPKKEEKKKCC